MRKACYGFVLVLCCLSKPVAAQNFGLSFSYFLPKHGYFSTPISPFSIRGLGVNLNRFVAIQTGASLYLISGLNLKDLPFDSKAPLIGPNFTAYVPAELVLQLHIGSAELDLKGGGFAFYGLGTKINYGNFDRALAAYENLTVVNSDLSFSNHPGFGYYGGAELSVDVTSTIGISLEGNYLVGQAKFPLTGSYTGGTSAINTYALDYPDAKIDFTGLEFSFGVYYKSGGGPSKNRRRR